MSDRTCVETDLIVMIGDFNIDPLKGDIKSKTLCDVMKMNDLKISSEDPHVSKACIPAWLPYALYQNLEDLVSLWIITVALVTGTI